MLEISLKKWWVKLQSKLQEGKSFWYQEKGNGEQLKALPVVCVQTNKLTFSNSVKNFNITAVRKKSQEKTASSYNQGTQEKRVRVRG